MKTKAFNLLAILFMAILPLGLTACGDDDDNGGSVDNPITTADPAGTITVNIRNKNNGGYGSDGVELKGLTTFTGSGYDYDGYLYIDEADNLFCSDDDDYDEWTYPDFEIVSLGKVNGLGGIKNIPKSGWGNKAAVIPGYGYIVRGMESNEYIRHYARIYVVDYMESTTGGVIGAIVKIQCPWGA